jgi:phosphoribosylaminoimidazole-succinocarboxamide synthase
MSIAELPAKALDTCVVRTNAPGYPVYHGKVRDVYTLPGGKLALIASDRISAFDFILRQPIPFKGQILNQTAAFFLKEVSDIVRTHLIDVPHPNVTIGHACKPVPIEVVMRGYLIGHAWRTYRSGKRTLCGVPLPDGLTEYARFEVPLLTPATKATEGHDEDISEKEILQRGLVQPEVWQQIREKAFKLFQRGQELAEKRGLLLADTKYEFGILNGEIVLIDEVHTPDSSRYFYADGFDENVRAGRRPAQLSKEFVREWLMARGFQGLHGQVLPDLDDAFREEIYRRYATLFETVTGLKFKPHATDRFNQELPAILAAYSS